MSIKHETLGGMVHILLYEQKLLWAPSSKFKHRAAGNERL
jgi:hypothetical protein